MCQCNEPKYYGSCDCTVRAESIITTDVFLTTDEFNTLKSQIEEAFADKQSWFNDMRYGIVSKDKSYRKDLFLLIILFSYWQQNNDGTDTGYVNYITRAEFSQAINKARRIVGATIIN